MPIAAGFGYWCDGQLDSSPAGLLLGVSVGFMAMLLRIVRMRPGHGEPAEAAETKEETTESSAVADRPESDEESDR